MENQFMESRKGKKVICSNFYNDRFDMGVIKGYANPASDSYCLL